MALAGQRGRAAYPLFDGGPFGLLPKELWIAVLYAPPEERHGHCKVFSRGAGRGAGRAADRGADRCAFGTAERRRTTPGQSQGASPLMEGAVWPIGGWPWQALATAVQWTCRRPLVCGL